MKLAYFFLFTLIALTSFGQDRRPISISAMPKTGFLIAHRPHMSHLLKDRNNGLEVEVSLQDDQRNPTAWSYRYPSKGISFSYQSFGYEEVLGSSYSILQFTKFNLIQKSRFGFLDLRIGSGISYLTKTYDVLTNPKNNAIGSHLNAFVNFQLIYEKYWKNFLIGAGLEISHFSNAAMTVPNLGLNTPMFFLKVGYSLAPRVVFENKSKADFPDRTRLENRFQFHAIGGIKQNLPGYTISKYHPVLALQALYRKKISFKWDLEGGLDLVYNAANRFKYDDQSFTSIETIQMGLYLGGAANFYKSQIFFGLGSYVYNKINPAGWVFNRIGYRYNFSEHLNAVVAIKANIGIADYLEFGLGWRF